MLPSFEEIGVGASLAEALAAEGIEVPTQLQALAYPVLKRGNSAVLHSAPGGGGLVSYVVPLLDRLDPEATEPRALVLAGDRGRAGALALATARLASATGHRVGALGIPWALPERAALLFGTVEDLARAIESSQVKVDGVTALVLDGAAGLMDDRLRLSAIMAALPAKDLQVVLITDPITPEVRRFVDDHSRRAVYLPPEAAVPVAPPRATDEIHRGDLRVRTAAPDDDEALPRVVAELLEEGLAHVLVFSRSEDRAADVGDGLALRGFAAGAPGDPEVPVWLGVNAIEAREAIREIGAVGTFAVVSVDAPTDADEMDRRHGAAPESGVVLAHPRELPHLHATGRAAGYSLVPWPPKNDAPGGSGAFLAEIERAIDEEDLLPYLVTLEPLFRKRGAEEVAAALARLLRRKSAPPRPPGVGSPAGSEAAAEREVPGTRPPAWVRLFLSLGDKDGVGPGDVLGAILGESGVQRDQVGRIDLRDTFSRVEVHEAVADRIIRALNGTTIRGRSVRADFDRQEKRPPPKSRPKGKRPKG